ncbi:hypothetical protein VTN77DRAFT_4432 [Rasamsonia byssochlamydoides]|uniref:uncharacterized protein n=1 Tax=Rasamsonia byssochlamydoides TaxID=89139 RepID=UPI00374484CB
MAESPGSPLSSIASDELTEDIKLDKDEAHSPSASNMPPSKRRRTGMASWDPHTPDMMSSVHEENLPTSPSTSISSDTSGDIPNSPSLVALIGGGQDDDYSGQGGDQVSVCRWDGCEAGDLGNMDDLVEHIHRDHIGTRQKKYSCEWIDCSRKGQTHASGYALRAHMRSHTREKPFYCMLPECDRSFTRSDALAKHMRTVHETEALRPSDPVPKNQTLSSLSAAATPTTKVQRIKLKLSSQPKEEGGEQNININVNGEGAGAGATAIDPEDLDSIPLPEFGPELGFDEHELSLRPKELYRLLRRQIHWAELENAKLRQQWEEEIEPQRFEAWRAKEAIFDDLIEAEMRLHNVLMEQQHDSSSNNNNNDAGIVPNGQQNGVQSTRTQAVST